MEKEKPQEKKPERHVLDGSQGLCNSHGQRVRPAEGSVHQQENERLSKGKTCRPKQDPSTGSSQPEKKTQDGYRGAEKIGAKMKLLATQPLELIRRPGGRDSFGTSDQRSGIETTSLPRIVGEQRGLPNAHSQNAALRLAQFKGLHRLRNVPNGARWQFAVMPNQRTVPIDFVRIMDLGHQKRKLLG